MWRSDAALAAADHGEDFLAWFEQTTLGPRDVGRFTPVPRGRLRDVAGEAQRRSALWMQFARALEARAAGTQ
jgi:hypothetical protein